MSGRVFFFDIIRVLLIFAVVHLHLHYFVLNQNDIFSRFEYYAVPVFLTLSFFLTGKYFLKENLETNKISARVKRLLLPLIFWSLVGFIPHPDLLTLPNVLVQLLTGELVNTPLYYLNLLILFSVFSFTLTKFSLPKRVVIFVASIVIAFFLQYSSANFYFFNTFDIVVQRSYGRFLELLPYAMLGLLFAYNKNRLDKDNRWGIGIVALGAICYLVALFIPKPPGFSYQGLELFFGTVTMFAFILQVARTKMEKIISESWEKLTHALGRYTFGIYLFHYPVLECLFMASPLTKQFAFQYSNLFLVLFLAASYLFCFAVDNLTKKKFSFLLQ